MSGPAHVANTDCANGASTPPTAPPSGALLLSWPCRWAHHALLLLLIMLHPADHPGSLTTSWWGGMVAGTSCSAPLGAWGPPRRGTPVWGSGRADSQAGCWTGSRADDQGRWRRKLRKQPPKQNVCYLEALALMTRSKKPRSWSSVTARIRSTRRGIKASPGKKRLLHHPLSPYTDASGAGLCS